MKKWISLLLAAALGLMTGCGSQEAVANLTPVTLNEVAHSIFYAPQYVAIENGYFAEEGIDLTLVTGFGADKVATALVSGEADIGFMGSESSIYIYNQNPEDYIVNFAQLTQRAGNFLVSREPMDNFKWEDIKGSYVLGGRKGGMPEMVFEFILKKNNIDPAADLSIDQSIDFGSTAAAFTGNDADFTVVYAEKYTAFKSDKILLFYVFKPSLKLLIISAFMFSVILSLSLLPLHNPSSVHESPETSQPPSGYHFQTFHPDQVHLPATL